MLNHFLHYLQNEGKYVAVASKVKAKEVFDKITSYAGLIKKGREEGRSSGYELPGGDISERVLPSPMKLGGNKIKFTGDLTEGAYSGRNLLERGFEVLHKGEDRIVFGRECPDSERSLSYEMHLHEGTNAKEVPEESIGDTWFYFKGEGKPKLNFDANRDNSGSPGSLDFSEQRSWIPRKKQSKPAEKKSVITFSGDNQTQTESGKFKL